MEDLENKSGMPVSLMDKPVKKPEPDGVRITFLTEQEETSKTKMPAALMQAKTIRAKGQMPSGKAIMKISEDKSKGSRADKLVDGKMPAVDMNVKRPKPSKKRADDNLMQPPSLQTEIEVRRPHVFHKSESAETKLVYEILSRQKMGPTGFDYPTTFRGSTAHFNVYYDPSLGTGGATIADGVLASCEDEYNYLKMQFGGIDAGPFNIIIAAGIGGAFHWGCAATDLYCDADTSATPDVDHTRMLVVAEETEVFSAVQNLGWDCGASNGEGLSRIFATELYPAELNGFTSAGYWLDTPGRPDYVNVNDPTDRNYISIGCSVLFLNYLHYQLGYRWEHITCAAASTLAETYTKLTGRTGGFDDFKALLQVYFPEGTPSGVTIDNVFPLGAVSTGRLEVFVRGSDGAVWHNWQTAPNNGWSGWDSLGGWVSELVVGKNADGRLEVFAIGGDNALWHNWQTGYGWSGWDSLGGWIDRLAVARNADGRQEVFARGADGALWHIWQTAPNNGWSGWYSFGGWIDMITTAQNADGRIEVFVRGGDGAVWHIWQTAPSNGWSGWDSLGGWIDILNVGQNADGRLEVFARGSDGALWHNWQTAPNNGWSGWASMGGWIDRIAVGQNADGRLEVFARGGDGAVWHNWQTAPNNGWSGWGSLGGWIDMLALGSNQDGRIELFARGGDAGLWHNWQTAPNNGWSGWGSMGGWFDLLAVGQNSL
ncbi:MAG: hypothetical protein JO072_05050 [Parafilimonas sp.]|nr:hypothetical protein [Parafilimonas sp.]